MSVAGFVVMVLDSFDVGMIVMVVFGLCVTAFGWWLTHSGDDDKPTYPSNHGLAFDSKSKDL